METNSNPSYSLKLWLSLFPFSPFLPLNWIYSKKVAAKKPAAKKSPAKKSPAKKSPAKKSPAKKTASKKSDKPKVKRAPSA